MRNLDSILAIIPAKKKSLRLQNKNLMLFNGNPLIYYSIKFAIKSGLKNIIVSSDCKKILSYSKKLGVNIIERPKFLSKDTTPTISVLKHATKYYISKNSSIDTIVTLQPTNPIRYSDLFRSSYDKFLKNDFDSLISVGINRLKIGYLDQFNLYKPLNYSLGSRSQDVKISYYENGLIYFSKLENILNGDLYGKKIGSIIINDISSLIDIDYKHDFEYAELVFKKNKSDFDYLLN